MDPQTPAIIELLPPEVRIAGLVVVVALVPLAGLSGLFAYLVRALVRSSERAATANESVVIELRERLPKLATESDIRRGCDDCVETVQREAAATRRAVDTSGLERSVEAMGREAMGLQETMQALPQRLTSAMLRCLHQPEDALRQRASASSDPRDRRRAQVALDVLQGRTDVGAPD